MNVAIELLVRTYEIPKDVMHYIMHMFRPRAAPYPLDESGKLWEAWTCLAYGEKYWYSFRISTRRHVYQNRPPYEQLFRLEDVHIVQDRGVDVRVTPPCCWMCLRSYEFDVLLPDSRSALCLACYNDVPSCVVHEAKTYTW